MRKKVMKKNNQIMICIQLPTSIKGWENLRKKVGKKKSKAWDNIDLELLHNIASTIFKMEDNVFLHKRYCSTCVYAVVESDSELLFDNNIYELSCFYESLCCKKFYSYIRELL
jgi:hypothetical protein